MSKFSENWSVSSTTLGEQVTDGIVTDKSDWVCIENEDGVVAYTHESRANLISAAPDMYEVLTLAEKYINPAYDGPCPSPDELLRDIRDAIARAEGKTP